MDALSRALMMVASSTPVVLRPVTCTGLYSAGLSLMADGSAIVSAAVGEGADFTWLLRGSSSDYQASYSLISGTPLNEAAGTWFSLSSGRTFSRTSKPTAGSSVVELSIRYAATGAIVARAVITFTTLATGIVATVTPTSNTTEFDSATVNSATFTCNATGGIGAYSYNWLKVSGGAIGFATGSTNKTAIFQATGMSPGESRTATFRCNVSTTPGEGASNIVTVTLKRPA